MELKNAIEKEKQQKLKKKLDERNAAWKVIRENEVEKKKKVAEKEKERLD